MMQVSQDSPESRLYSLGSDAFFSMLRIRLVEEMIGSRYPEQMMRNPVHLCTGQEATPVGVSQNLRLTDKVMSGHRSHGHYLAKGGDLKRMIAELYGRATGCCRGRGGSQHLVDQSAGFMGAAPILATTVPIATGVAWTMKARKSGDIVVAYFGDGATEEGCVHEAMSFASLHSLPILFICENNLLSTHSHLDVRQPKRALSDLAAAHAMPGVTVDGMDVRSVSVAVSKAAKRARHGDGPTFIESKTYRYVGHVGPGEETNMGYRSQTELDEWMLRDPIALENERLSEEIPKWESIRPSMEEMITIEIEAAFHYAMTSPFPDISELVDSTFPKAVLR